MKKRVCTTYLSVDWDTKKNSEPIRMERKEEIERLIIDDIGMQPIWQQHQWILARQDHDSKNINEMLRKTLSGLFGKESAIKELQDRFQVQAVLRIVFYFDKNTDVQELSLEHVIIAFLYQANVIYDLTYSMV